jgi:hypothetical protein
MKKIIYEYTCNLESSEEDSERASKNIHSLIQSRLGGGGNNHNAI